MTDDQKERVDKAIEELIRKIRSYSRLRSKKEVPDSLPAFLRLFPSVFHKIREHCLEILLEDVKSFFVHEFCMMQFVLNIQCKDKVVRERKIGEMISRFNLLVRASNIIFRFYTKGFDFSNYRVSQMPSRFGFLHNFGSSRLSPLGNDGCQGCCKCSHERTAQGRKRGHKCWGKVRFHRYFLRK